MPAVDPLIIASAAYVALSIFGGRAVVYGVDRLPRAWRRTAQWTFVIAAAVTAIAADVAAGGRGPHGPFAVVVAALPGIVAYLVWRMLVASALISLLPLYFVIGALTPAVPRHMPFTALDRLMPLQPSWMLAYGSMYVFVLLPLLVVRHPPIFRRALRSYVTVILIAYAGFLLYPTVTPRPASVAPGGFAAWCLRLNYALDTRYNCFPSLHVAHSFISALSSYRVHRRVGLIAALWAAVIGVSTVYTKQHYAIDVVGGALSALLAYAIFLRGYPRALVPETDVRRAPRRALIVVGIYAIFVAGVWVAYQARSLAS